MAAAHAAITENAAANDVGTTTLLGGVLVEIVPEGEIQSKFVEKLGYLRIELIQYIRWAFVCTSVGDCKAYLYRHKSRKVVDLISDNRGGIDTTDPGGRLGPINDRLYFSIPFFERCTKQSQQRDMVTSEILT